MKRSLLCAGLAVIALVVHLAAQAGGTITGQVFVRERENGDQSLLVNVEAPNGVTRVDITLPRRFTFSTRYPPDRWALNEEERSFSFTGDQVFRFNLRMDADRSENVIRNLQGREIELRIGTPGATTLKTKVGVLPRVRFRDDWSTLVALTFPPEYTPGKPILVSPAPEYANGVFVPGWDKVEASLGRAELYLKRAEMLLGEKARTPPRTDQRLFNWTKIFDELADFENSTPRFSFIDQYLEPLLQGRPAIKAVPDAACATGVTGGTPMAFTGKDACMQGCFGEKLTDLEKAAILLLDDKPVLPQAASPTTVVVRIPNDATPGPHSLTWQGVPGQLSIRILSVQGSIDQNQLWRGQSTTMRLQILGSDQPIPLKIVNRTPTTIQVEGGESQVLQTSGGPVNVVNRQVKGILKGDFTIDYSVDQPPCGR